MQPQMGLFQLGRTFWVAALNRKPSNPFMNEGDGFFSASDGNTVVALTDANTVHLFSLWLMLLPAFSDTLQVSVWTVFGPDKKVTQLHFSINERKAKQL